MAGELTLLEASKGLDSVFQRAVIETFVSTNRLFQILPFRSISGGHDGILMESELPTVSTRGVNEAYTRSHGKFDEIVQALKIYGGDIGIDPFIMRTKGQEQATRQIGLKVKAIANNWLLDFFKGDAAADPRDMDGLQNRITGANLVSNTSSAGLSMMSLDTAIAQTHRPTALLMNRALTLRITEAARSTATLVGGANITRTADEFGNQILRYNGLEVVAVTDAADADVVLPFTEGTSQSSIYVVGFGDEGIEGIQNGTIEPRSLGEDNTTPREDTRIEWYSNFQIQHPRSVTRLQLITDAAAIA